MSVGRNALWNLGLYGGGKLVAFISTVVLARLLAPDAFGLVAMGMLAINVFDRLKDLGVGAALVRSPHKFASVAPTGAVLTVVSSTTLSLLCLVTAPQLASLLGDDRLTDVVRALSLSLLVAGLAILPDSALQRRLLFRDRTVPEISGALVRAIVSIGLALTGSGVWSLVWGQVAGSAVTTTLFWIAYRRRLNGARVFGWSAQEAKHLVSYGASVSGIALLALVLDNLDYFFIGRRLGAEQLGYYTMAFRLPELLVLSVCAVIGQVLFSSFSRLQEDLPALREHYRSASASLAALSVPMGVGLSATAPEVIQLVLGTGFSDATVALRYLGLYSAVYSLGFYAGEVYKATGRTRLMINLSLVRLAVFAPAMWWAAGYSIEMVAGTFLGLHVIFGVVRLALIQYVLKLSMLEQWRTMWPPLLSSALAAAAVHGLGLLLPGDLAAWLRLAIFVVAGIVVYLLTLALFDRQAVTRARAMVSGLRGPG